MRFQFSEAQQEFRHELQEFLKAELGSERPIHGSDRAFSKKLAERRWIGIAWPEQYGGRGLGALEQMIYTEEMILANAPRGYHFIVER